MVKVSTVLPSEIQKSLQSPSQPPNRAGVSNRLLSIVWGGAGNSAIRNLAQMSNQRIGISDVLVLAAFQSLDPNPGGSPQPIRLCSLVKLLLVEHAKTITQHLAGIA